MDPTTRSVLTRLHSLSLDQERALSARHVHFPGPGGLDASFEDQLVALDEEKAMAMYLVLRSMRATRVVEAGTSYGVSLIWILSAVTSTLSSHTGTPHAHPPLVIGTENSPQKASLALSHVRQAFPSASPSSSSSSDSTSASPIPFLSLLQGDLLSTLPAFSLADSSVDALLLDIWTPLALPTLRLLLPKLRPGAVVFVDNVDSSKDRYAQLIAFLDDAENHFTRTTLPYSGGFAFCLYQPPPSLPSPPPPPRSSS